MPHTEGKHSLTIGLGAGIGLVIVKLVAGLWGQSQALVADALNSLLDVVAAGVAWIGYRIARRPPDANHHYGHQNAETIAALFVGLAIFATGGIIIRDALVTLWRGTAVTPAIWTVAVAAGVILGKIALFIYTRRTARRTRSLVVSATATDHLVDVVATSGVLVGVLGAQFGWAFLDPLAAFWVAGIILVHGVKILRTNTFVLLGGAPSEKTLSQIRETLTAVPGVLGLHRTKVRTAGTYLWVDTEVLVDGSLSVGEAHGIANSASDRLLATHPAIAEVVVHIEPHSARRAAEGADPLTPRARSRENTATGKESP